MHRDTIYRIESIPGDPARGIEQPNGDLLLPSAARIVVEDALARLEGAMGTDPVAMASLKEAHRLLGIYRAEPEPPVRANLLKVRAI